MDEKFLLRVYDLEENVKENVTKYWNYQRQAIVISFFKETIFTTFLDNYVSIVSIDWKNFVHFCFLPSFCSNSQI